MDVNLRNIQRNRFNSEQAGRIISKTVSDLKTLNTKMKIFLNQEKLLYLRQLRAKQESLWKIGNKISTTLDTLLLSVSRSLINKNRLSDTEKKVVESLVKLRQENTKMKAFSTTQFSSFNEMENYIKSVVSAIRNEFVEIRKI